MRQVLIASFKKQIDETRAKIAEDMARQQSAVDEEVPLCEICYTNEIVAVGRLIPADELGTVEFECEHHFCSECSLEQLKQHIERAAIDKLVCFHFECKKAISDEKIREILLKRNRADLVEKFAKFKGQKQLDSDPLVRWCPNPSCGDHMRADSKDTKKMTCKKCQTELCFQCKDKWHGEDTTCEEAMKSQLAGWADENNDKVSLCPLCRTRIEKSAGCNHMTCGFCKYEFCWACGASSTSDDNHFGFMRGCGVGMMDESAKPGSKATSSRCCQIFDWFGWVLLMIILYPFFLVLFMPIAMAYAVTVIVQKDIGGGCCVAAISAPIGFVIGLIIDIGFIPAILIVTLCFLAT